MMEAEGIVSKANHVGKRDFFDEIKYHYIFDINIHAKQNLASIKEYHKNIKNIDIYLLILNKILMAKQKMEFAQFNIQEKFL